MRSADQKQVIKNIKLSMLPQTNSIKKMTMKQIQQLKNKRLAQNQTPGGSSNKKHSKKIIEKMNPAEKINSIQHEHSQILYFSNRVRKIPIQKPNSTKKQNTPCTVTRIQANGKISAVSDNSGNVWILGMIFPHPINLTEVINKKVIDSFLGQKGIILKTKTNFYVINWDKIDLPKQILKKVEIDKKFDQYFECYQQIIPYRSDAWFMFSSKKDSLVETCFYRVFADKLIIYPNFAEVNLNKKIKGISASKTHTLCWTECGKIYSWGQKSLALGYTQFSDETTPKQIQSVNFDVVSAVAGVHYSVALSSQGHLFQWGIKNTICKKTDIITEEFIFVPKKMQIKFNSEDEKISCLKGNQGHFGALSFKQNFYVWGKRIPRVLLEFDGIYREDNESVQPHSQHGLQAVQFLCVPTLCKCSQSLKIIDFQLREDYVFLVTADKLSNIKNILSEQFWSYRLENISNKLLNNRNKTNFKIKLENINSQSKQNMQIPPQQMKVKSLGKHRKHQSALQIGINKAQLELQKYSYPLNSKLTGYEDKISKAIKQRLCKQEYFNNLLDEQSMFKKIMAVRLNQNQRSKVPTQHYMMPKSSNISYVQLQRKCINKAFAFRNSEGDSQNNQKSLQQKRRSKFRNTQSTMIANFTPIDYQKIETLLKQSPLEQVKRRRRLLYESIKKRQNKIRTMNNTPTMSPNKDSVQPYSLKLTQVLSKKELICNDFFKSTIQKIQKSSIQFRRKQSQETAARKQRQQRHDLLKQSLFQYLVKTYVVKCLTGPIPCGRQTKIKIFASNLKYNRIQKSVRRLFATTRIRFNVNLLKQYMPKNLLKLLIVYRNFVLKWKQNKINKMVKYCVESIIRINSINKLKVGLHNTKVNTKNLQKIGAWLQISKKQKIKCLNTIWKRQILSVFTVLPQFQGQYNALNVKSEVKSFKQLYLQKLKSNPMLKIQNYLGFSPLFKIKMLRNCQQNIIQLILKKKESSQMESLTQKTIQLTKRSVLKQKTRLKQEGDQRFDLRYYVLNQNLYLLPYSKHARAFHKPKNFEINIGQNVKETQKWAEQEKKVLTKIFSKIIKNDHLEFQRKVYKYRRQMALFIRDNYAKICEKRWKYIIQYNQIKQEREQKEVKKKQKQLKKLLRIIGCQSILQNDILPQKHRILDEAKQMKGSPQLPQKWMSFGTSQFKMAFRQYMQALQNKTKSIKRFKNFHIP